MLIPRAVIEWEVSSIRSLGIKRLTEKECGGDLSKIGRLSDP